MELIPTRGKIVVENISDGKITPGGIIIAETVNEIPHRGLVLSIGLPYRDDKFREKEWHFKVGEIVHYKRQWNQTAKNYILLRNDIYAVEGDTGLRAVMDMVIVRRHYTKTIGGGTIILADTFGTTQNNSDFYGEVIAEGPESRFNFHSGDKILYSRDEGVPFRYNGEELFALKPRAVLAMVEI